MRTVQALAGTLKHFAPGWPRPVYYDARRAALREMDAKMFRLAADLRNGHRAHSKGCFEPARRSARRAGIKEVRWASSMRSIFVAFTEIATSFPHRNPGCIRSIRAMVAVVRPFTDKPMFTPMASCAMAPLRRDSGHATSLDARVRTRIHRRPSPARANRSVLGIRIRCSVLDDR